MNGMKLQIKNLYQFDEFSTKQKWRDYLQIKREPVNSGLLGFDYLIKLKKTQEKNIKSEEKSIFAG